MCSKNLFFQQYNNVYQHNKVIRKFHDITLITSCPNIKIANKRSLLAGVMMDLFVFCKYSYRSNSCCFSLFNNEPLLPLNHEILIYDSYQQLSLRYCKVGHLHLPSDQ